MKKQKKKTQSKSPVKTKALAVTPEYRETLKFKRWCQHFFDRKDKETYGNATKSALRVYNTEDYHTAGAIGHQNLKKLQNLRVSIADAEGFGYADMIRIGLDKMMKGEFDDWDKMMVRLGYHEPDPKTIVNNNTQNNFNFGSIQEALAASRKERGLNP